MATFPSCCFVALGLLAGCGTDAPDSAPVSANSTDSRTSAASPSDLSSRIPEGPVLAVRGSSVRPVGGYPRVGWGDGRPWVEVVTDHPVRRVELRWRHVVGDPNPVLREATGYAWVYATEVVELDFAPTAVTAVRTHLGGERVVWLAGIASDPVRELVVERWALSAPEVVRDEPDAASRLVPGRVAHRERFTLPERAHAEDAVVALAPLGHLEWGARRVIALLGGNAELVEVDLALGSVRTVAVADGPVGRLGPVRALRHRWDGFELPFVHRDLGLCVVARDHLGDLEVDGEPDRVEGLVLFGGALAEGVDERRGERGRPVPLRFEGSMPLTDRNEDGYELRARAVPAPPVEMRPASEPPPSWGRLSIAVPEDRCELLEVEVTWLETGVSFAEPEPVERMRGGAIGIDPSDERWTMFVGRRMARPVTEHLSIALAPGRYRVEVRDAGRVNGLELLAVEELVMGYADRVVAFEAELLWRGRGRVAFDVPPWNGSPDAWQWLVVHRLGPPYEEVPSRESREPVKLPFDRTRAELYVELSSESPFDRYLGSLPVVHWLEPGSYFAETYVRERDGAFECTALVAFEVADDDLTVDLTD